MSSWISRKQDRTIDGIPHLTKIIRKPKEVGTEIKCLADGVVGIMLRLEICEGKEAECRKKRSYLPAGNLCSRTVPASRLCIKMFFWILVVSFYCQVGCHFQFWIHTQLTLNYCIRMWPLIIVTSQPSNIGVVLTQL